MNLARAISCVAVLAAAGSAQVVCAQNGVRPGVEAEGPASQGSVGTVVLTARVQQAIAVDGRLDESDWDLARPITGFTQFEPVEGGRPSHRSSVRILYGDNALYVGAELNDAEPDRIVRTLGRRDEPSVADRFWVAIDSYFDRKTAYVFGVSAAGVQIDGVMLDDSSPRRPEPGRFSSVALQMDLSWNAVWSADVYMKPDGWSLEMRIPYSMLRFSEAEDQTWGINFRREIARLSEVNDWIMVPRQDNGSVRYFGMLQGLEQISPRRNLQITPYSLTGLTTRPTETGGLHYESTLDLGGDFKVGLSSNITLDATVNPDFGQIEADPAELNLTTFETVFPEKRPFFLEGVQIFDYSLGQGIGRDANLLYTRRVGVAESPIIAAAKLSGRTGSGISFGTFGATTGAALDPERYYGVARAKQELGRGQSYVGGIVTGYRRQGMPENARTSLAGGIDWDLRYQQSKYQLQGHVTLVSIAKPETDSGTRSGIGTSVTVERLRGNLTWRASLNLLDDQFNPNDLGQLRQNDLIALSGRAEHLINGNRPFGPLRRAAIRAFVSRDWTYRERTDMGYRVSVFGDAQTQGFHSLRFSTRGSRFGGYDVRETRGLGLYKQPGVLNLEAFFATDSRRMYRLEPGLRFGQTGMDGRMWGFEITGSWDASARLSLSGTLALEAEKDVPAWASNESFALIDGHWHVGRSNRAPADQEEGEFWPLEEASDLDRLFSGVKPFNRIEDRYFVSIFGSRDTRSADVTLRSNVTFTPTLSLQLYAQLFAAKGRYDRYRMLLSPSEQAPFETYPKRHDFALQSFNSNIVFRWEYRPGSVLFLVWSQGRIGDHDSGFPPEAKSPYEHSTSDRLFETFTLGPTNVLTVKFSYLFLR